MEVFLQNDFRDGYGQLGLHPHKKAWMKPLAFFHCKKKWALCVLEHANFKIIQVKKHFKMKSDCHRTRQTIGCLLIP